MSPGLRATLLGFAAISTSAVSGALISGVFAEEGSSNKQPGSLKVEMAYDSRVVATPMIETVYEVSEYKAGYDGMIVNEFTPKGSPGWNCLVIRHAYRNGNTAMNTECLPKTE